jgi:hypothetical protein
MFGSFLKLIYNPNNVSPNDSIAEFIDIHFSVILIETHYVFFSFFSEEKKTEIPFATFAPLRCKSSCDPSVGHACNGG